MSTKKAATNVADAKKKPNAAKPAKASRLRRQTDNHELEWGEVRIVRGEPRWFVPLDSIFPDPANANEHPESQIDLLCRNLKRFGQRKPVVLRSDKRMVIAGSGTYEAMQKNFESGDNDGFIWVTRAENLSPAEAAAFGLADNKLATLSHLNRESVATILGGIEEEGVFDEDFSLLGFSEGELAEFGFSEEYEGDGEDEDDEDKKFKRFDGKEEASYQCPKCKFEWSGKAK